MTDEAGFADRMNSLPKYVASRTLSGPLEWNASLLEGDVVEAVRKLREQPGRDLLIYGSGQLVDTLTPHGLIDEHRLMIHPVILGRGKRLFEEAGDSAGLILAESNTTPKGVVTLVYHQAE
jgi:dihydrofolate reductase